jgi:hypothetical protein
MRQQMIQMAPLSSFLIWPATRNFVLVRRIPYGRWFLRIRCPGKLSIGMKDREGRAKKHSTGASSFERVTVARW